MIERYSRDPMKTIWGEKRRYRAWLEVEAAVCEELGDSGTIPQADWKKLKPKLSDLIKRGGVEPSRVEFFEKTTRHDVIAFTTAVAEKLGPLSRYVHYGLAASDVVDTAMSVVVQEAGKELIGDIRALAGVLARLAKRYRSLPTIGRSHGIYAEPTSFGLKFLGWACEWKRNRERLESAVSGLRFGKLSGAVGVNAHWSPGVEKKILKRLGLKREPVSTQVCLGTGMRRF